MRISFVHSNEWTIETHNPEFSSQVLLIPFSHRLGAVTSGKISGLLRAASPKESQFNDASNLSPDIFLRQDSPFCP